jgi:hypothetical protein
MSSARRLRDTKAIEVPYATFVAYTLTSHSLVVPLVSDCLVVYCFGCCCRCCQHRLYRAASNCIGHRRIVCCKQQRRTPSALVLSGILVLAPVRVAPAARPGHRTVLSPEHRCRTVRLFASLCTRVTPQQPVHVVSLTRQQHPCSRCDGAPTTAAHVHYDAS